MGKVTLRGILVQKAFGRGSKSEHQAIYIKTEKADFVFRKKGTNPFENKELLELVGKTVEATGTINDYLFLAEEIKVID